MRGQCEKTRCNVKIRLGIVCGLPQFVKPPSRKLAERSTERILSVIVMSHTRTNGRCSVVVLRLGSGNDSVDCAARNGFVLIPVHGVCTRRAHR